jgi:hypothetical protein
VRIYKRALSYEDMEIIYRNYMDAAFATVGEVEDVSVGIGDVFGRIGGTIGSSMIGVAL